MHSVDATAEQMIRSVLAYAKNRLRLLAVGIILFRSGGRARRRTTA